MQGAMRREPEKNPRTVGTATDTQREKLSAKNIV